MDAVVAAEPFGAAGGFGIIGAAETFGAFFGTAGPFLGAGEDSDAFVGISCFLSTFFVAGLSAPPSPPPTGAVALAGGEACDWFALPSITSGKAAAAFAGGCEDGEAGGAEKPAGLGDGNAGGGDVADDVPAIAAMSAGIDDEAVSRCCVAAAATECFVFEVTKAESPNGWLPSTVSLSATVVSLVLTGPASANVGSDVACGLFAPAGVTAA